VAVAAVTLAWAVTAWVLARALKRARADGGLEVRIGTMARDLDQLVRDQHDDRAEMLSAMRDDRAATDRRLRWLETNLWTERHRTGS
jgi:hypothetical protein